MQKLIVTLFAHTLVQSFIIAAPSEVLPESSLQLDACGQSYNEIISITKSWHTKTCNGTELRAACIVPEHEQAYLELKKRCQEAYDQQTTQSKDLSIKLPEYMSKVMSSVSVLSQTLKNDMPGLETLFNGQKQQLENAWKYGIQLQRELLLTSIESDRQELALFLHSILLDSALSNILAESYRYHGANSRMVARILKFVRLLPGSEDRVSAYKQMAELLQSNGQDERFPAVIFSVDAKEISNHYNPDHSLFQGKAVTRWQSQLLAGNFTEVALFAQDFTAYYMQVEADLLGVLNNQWSVQGLSNMIFLPNALPGPVQRVRAFKAVLEALLQHQDKQHNDAFLMRLAHEISFFESSLNVEAPEVRQALDASKELFSQFSYKRDFTVYTELYEQFRAAI
ncbi:uncharacterized protein LOC128729083 [Anopheles nili]|uniref:uncharacterized protein LOC128729083 n=1 Tax=Anopheles nili TaxID=185578 RepID=UPI00237B54DC|nr:uncharacterized protein LOC128729083 [Anopheles nili]